MPIDGYYKTNYTSRTVKGIHEIYKNIKFICINCKVNKTESKMEIKDTKYPLFIILRKKYCFKCWLEIINSL